MRSISDVRLVNNYCDKNDYPACENPALVDLAHRVEMLDRNSPAVPRRVTERDVSEAPKRVANHPDCVSILRTEFPGNELGLAHDIIFSGLRRLSVGLHLRIIPRHVRVTLPNCTVLIIHSPVAGNSPFLPHMFVGDAMIIEVDFPGRLEQSVNAWGSCCEKVLGLSSASEYKKKVEGEWLESAILSGFRSDVESKWIYLPDANVEGSKLALDRPCYNAGDTVVLLKTLQELRGMFTHYSNCNQVWETLAQPIDSLLAYPDESSRWIRCDDVEIWRAFWNMIQFTKQALDTHEGGEICSAASCLTCFLITLERVSLLSGSAFYGSLGTPRSPECRVLTGTNANSYVSLSVAF